MTYDNVRATAPLDPTPDQLTRAQEQRALPVFPVKLNDPELRLIRRPPQSLLADSYRTQRYSFRDGDTHYILTPELPGTEPSPSVEPPLDLPVHILSNWHGGGAPSTFGDCLAAQEESTARLSELNRSFQLAIAIAEDLTWFEGFSMVSGLEDGQVVEMARGSGQPAVIRWDAAGLSVLPTGLRADIPASKTAWRLESTEVATCPVRKDADPAGRCTNYGGPYGGHGYSCSGALAGAPIGGRLPSGLRSVRRRSRADLGKSSRRRRAVPCQRSHREPVRRLHLAPAEVVSPGMRRLDDTGHQRVGLVSLEDQECQLSGTMIYSTDEETRDKLRSLVQAR